MEKYPQLEARNKVLESEVIQLRTDLDKALAQLQEQVLPKEPAYEPETETCATDCGCPMLADPQVDIEIMMHTYNQEVKDNPGIPDDNTLLLRARLIFEECMETIEAMGCSMYLNDGRPEGALSIKEDLEIHINEDLNPDIIKIADGLGDLLVVTYGAGCACGIKLQPVLDEINRSNGTKLWKNEETGDMEVRKREDGKVTKPPTYSPADIESVLAQQRA